MSIKRDKKTVKVITILSGILFFGLVMGIVIFSLPDTKSYDTASTVVKNPRACEKKEKTRNTRCTID